MKKSILLMSLLLAVLCIGLASCSNNDKEEKFNYDKELLYGTWKITHAEGLTWWQTTTTATFYADGKYYGKGYFGTGSGTYQLSGDRITCYVDGKKYMWYDVVSLSGTECTLVASDNSGSMTIKCKKQ